MFPIRQDADPLFVVKGAKANFVVVGNNTPKLSTIKIMELKVLL